MKKETSNSPEMNKKIAQVSILPIASGLFKGFNIIGKDDELINRFITGSHKHAKRRMHEMEEVASMLNSENLSAIMSIAAINNLKKYIK